MTTVSGGVADQYMQFTEIRPTIINNAVFYQDLQPTKRNNKDKTIRLIHHGTAIPSRKIENMILMMNYLDERFELYLMFIETRGRYLSKLRDLAKSNLNVHFVEPKPMLEISKHINQYDVGLYILEPNGINNRYALPNKLFEYIQARLAIAISPSVEMAKIVNKYDLGLVAGDFTPESMAKELLKLNPERLNHFKNQSHKAAKLLNAEKNSMSLLEVVERTLKNL